MAAGTVTDPMGRSWPAASNSCADVRAAFTQAHVTLGYPSYSAVSCSADPVKAGTVLSFSPSGSWAVSAITATATTTGDTGGTTGGTGGTTGGTGTTTVSAGSTTLTLVVTPYRATADDYQALSVIFGAVLAAASVIWGVKRLYVLLTNRPEA
jgi:hypothetical protein